MLRIHNSLSRSKEPFEPIEPGRVRMYICGITVYDYCHIGHARMMLVFDMVSRWLRASGYALTYVRNITDIDDKIIKRSVDNKETIGELTERFIAAMHHDLDALGVLRPDHEPRATHYVPQMLDLIGLLERNELAYRAVDGDVNYAVRRFANYGRLSGKSLDELRAGERVAVTDAKHDPLDFVLWKAAKASDPVQATWPSDFGPGRPGWHIECSAMAGALLGESIDIHGGGVDLQFPHHENEIAQSEGAHGGSFVRYWMHNGFVRVDNEKMSKSLGNFFTIRELLRVFDPEVLRLFVLRAHYRSSINYSDAHLDDARASLLRLYTALTPGTPGTPSTPGTLDVSGHDAHRQPPAQPDWTTPSGQRFREAMDDDFNTPIAVSVLFDLASELNRTRDPATERELRSLASVLGLLAKPPEQAVQSGLRGSDQTGAGVSDADIDTMVARRTEAKKARQFAQADQLRAELLEQGVILEDSATGTRWRRS